MDFLNNFDKESIFTNFEPMLRQFEEAFNVYLTLHDFSGILFHIDGKRIFASRNYHPCPFCAAGRFTEPNWRHLCPRDCLTYSDSRILREAKPFMKNCWKGVTELVVPIIRAKKVLAAVYIGGFKGEVPDEIKLPPKYLKMHECLPEIPDDDTIQKLKASVTVLMHGMIGAVECVIEQDTQAEYGRKYQISRFIQENVHKKIKLEDLARSLYLSPSRTGHLVRNLFKRSFTELLVQERMLRAKSLLSNDWIPVEDVANAAGYDNIYYFNTAFKKYFGLPPGRFRSRLKISSDN